jgi:CubicO group peptidase (beta-lactamase class C family)
MYVVGAHIVSALTGIRYPDFVNSRIFKPLGMTSSTYSINAALKTGRFTNTWTSFGRLIPPWIKEEYVDISAGPGGAISSVIDLARHATIWCYLKYPRLTPFAGSLGQNDSERWNQPRYECNNHPVRTVQRHHVLPQYRGSQRQCGSINPYIRTRMVQGNPWRP